MIAETYFFYKSIKLPLQTQGYKCLSLPFWTKSKKGAWQMLENSTEPDPAPGSTGWVWCGPVGPAPMTCCSAPLPHTSPLQTAPCHRQQARRFCTIHQGSESTYGNIQLKDRKAIASEWPAKYGEVGPQTEEHLRNLQPGKLPKAPRMKTSPDSQWSPIVRDCFKDSCKYAQLTSWIRNIERSTWYLMLLTTVLPKSLSWRCVQSDLCGASKHKQNPAMSCKKLRKFILQFLWRKKTQLQAIIQYKVKKTEYHKIRKRRKGKQVLELSLCCEGTLFYEAASRFSTCKEKNKMLKAQLIIGKRSNQYHTLTLVGTPALTACKHAACQQTALCWPALLMSQVRGGGKGIFSDRVPHLETWLLHLLLEASTGF